MATLRVLTVNLSDLNLETGVIDGAVVQISLERTTSFDAFIMVPTLGSGQGSGEFLALGQFGEPGFHPHTEGMDMIRAIAKAGGMGR